VTLYNRNPKRSPTLLSANLHIPALLCSALPHTFTPCFTIHWHLVVHKQHNTTTSSVKYILAMSATLTYPPGGSFFDTIKKNFTDVPVDAANGNAINTTDFLQAAESLTGLFGKIRSLRLNSTPA